MIARKKPLLQRLIFFSAFTFVLFLPGLGLSSQAWASTSVPSIITNTVINVADNKATLNAKIESVGKNDIKEYGFYYGTTKFCPNKQKVGDSIGDRESFAYTLSNLNDDTMYYFKPYVENSEGLVYFGNIKYFTTLNNESEKPPLVITDSATNLTENAATLSGKIDSDGGNDITEYGFCYGTTSSCATWIKVENVNEGGSFKYDLTSLGTDTKYYFKAYAKNSEGIGYGSLNYFTLLGSSSDAPKVTTNSATNIGKKGATLNARIDLVGKNDITEYGFYYGSTYSCLSNKKVGTIIDKGDSFNCNLNSLNDDTKYYFKAYAKNGEGISYGSVKYFTTKKPQDQAEDADFSVTTETPFSGPNYVTLYGVVNPKGNSIVRSYGFYFGTTSFPDTQIEVDSGNFTEYNTFNYRFTDLSPNITYYVRAYATNDNGTSYGSILSFKGSGMGSPPIVHSGNLSKFIIGSKDFEIMGTNQTGDVAPYIKDDRTFLPLRYVAYALGLTDSNILWNEATQQITLIKDAKVIKLTINNTTMIVNGISVTMDTAPQITNGRTCLPIAQVAQEFGATATWDDDTQSITIR